MNKTLAIAIVTALSIGSVAFAHAGKGHGKHFERMDAIATARSRSKR